MPCFKCSTALAIALLGSIAVAQAPSSLKKGDRPVFLSAKELADDCREYLTVFLPGGKPVDPDKTYNVSMEQIGKARSCYAYIQGVSDERLENALGSHYHPVPARLNDLERLLDILIKYVSEHPEEQDFAATTLLDKAIEMVANTEHSKANSPK
jgi:hypothetical protein